MQKHGHGGRADDDLDPFLTEREKYEKTIEKIHENDMTRRDDNEDQDYIRADLHNADDEEFEDKIIEQARMQQRPLNLDEVSRISRNYKVDG